MRSLTRPVFIIGTPRSGTTQLFEILSSSEGLWSLYKESTIWNTYGGPHFKNWESMELSALDYTPQVAEKIKAEFTKHLQNHELTTSSKQLGANHPIRFVEKTPDNCFRVEFIYRIFPDAQFIYITRDPRNAISSMMEAWRHYKKYAIPFPVNIDLQNGERTNQWWGSLPAGWKKYSNTKLVQVCAFQWMEGNRRVLQSLNSLPATKVIQIRYENLTQNPQQVVNELCKKIGIPFSETVRSASKRIYPVNPNKWQQNNKEAVLSVWDEVKEMARRLGYSP
jgi:hypothetical protein